MRIGPNIFTVILFYISIVIFVEMFFSQNAIIVTDSLKHSPLYNGLLGLTCVLGFTFISLGYSEVAWLRLLASMLCCVVVYQIYPILTSIVDVIRYRTPAYTLVKDGRTITECLIVSMHLILMIGYMPCFDRQSTRPKCKLNSLGFLTKPLIMTIAGTFVWVLNQYIVEILCVDAFQEDFSDIYQILGMLQAGAFIALFCYVMWRTSDARRPQSEIYADQMGVFNIIGGVMILGFFIIHAPKRHYDLYAMNTFFCIFGSIFGAFFLTYLRRLTKWPGTLVDILEIVIAAGVTSIRGLPVEAGWAIFIGLIVSFFVTIYKYIIAVYDLKRADSVGVLIVIGAVIGIFTDITKFGTGEVYAIVAICIVIGSLFGFLTGLALNQFVDYDVEDFGRPVEIEA